MLINRHSDPLFEQRDEFATAEIYLLVFQVLGNGQ